MLALKVRDEDKILEESKEINNKLNFGISSIQWPPFSDVRIQKFNY
jgi:hypothetical protein